MILSWHTEDHVSTGAYVADKMLGIRSMPDGYALMLNCDRTHFYWLRSDGKESCIHWDKWAVYRSAAKDAEANKNTTG